MHMSELEKPKTDDCQESNTLEQLKILFKSQASGVEGLEAKLIFSTVWMNEATRPTAEANVSTPHSDLEDVFLVRLAIALIIVASFAIANHT